MEGRLEGCTGFDLMVDWLVVEMVDRLVVVLMVSMDVPTFDEFVADP